MTEASAADRRHQPVARAAPPVDRASPSRTPVRDRPADPALSCQAWPVRRGDRSPKAAFALAWGRGTIRCPNGVTRPFAANGTGHFPAALRAAGPLRGRRTSRAPGRSGTIPPDARRLQELRERQHTPAGRAKPRERVAVGHMSAPVGYWHGDRARYRGRRKTLCDLRRTGGVPHRQLLQRQRAAAPAAAAA